MSDTLVVSSNEIADHHDVVATPLDAIARLEHRRVRTVVLAGSYANDRELAAFLRDFYPRVRVVRDA